MRNFRTALLSSASKLYKTMAVPMVILGLIVSIGVLVFLYNKEKEILSLKMTLYVERLRAPLQEIESKYNPVISRLFQSEFNKFDDTNTVKVPFSDSFMEDFRAAIHTVDFDKLEIEEINYYRISEEGIVFESDFKEDIGLDLSAFDYFWGRLQELEVGEIFLDILNDETLTGELRLYSYIKLPDSVIFETGIKFKGVREFIESSGMEIFGNKFNQLTLYKNYDDIIWGKPFLDERDLNHLDTSEQEEEAVLVLKNLLTSTLYYRINTEYGAYDMILDTHFYYSFIAIGMFVLLFAVVFFHYLRIKRNIVKIAERVTKPISLLAKNIKDFGLSHKDSEPSPIETDIMEIDTIYTNFLAMRHEVKDSYAELEAINEELEDSVNENQILLNRIEELMSVPDFLLYVDDTEEFLIRCFRKLCEIFQDVDYGLASLIEDGKLKFIDTKGYSKEFLNQMEIDAQKFMKYTKVTLKDYEGQEFALNFSERERTFQGFEESVSDVNQSLILPIFSKNQYYGHLTFYTTEKGRQLTEEDYRTAVYFMNFLQGFLMIHELSELENEIQKETVYSMIRLLEKHDPYTKGHSENVAELASGFGEYLGLDSKKAQDLYWAGIIHDLGKILIPHTILNKPDRLTPEEFELIKKHPEYCYDVIGQSVTMKEIALYVKYHHEKYNGKGYPEGLKGEEIPFESRILALADSWDAMREERVYKKGLNYQESINEITRNAGVQFDPQLAEKWVQFIDKKRKEKFGEDSE
ncbi:MAG: hypothetical protein PWQ84_1339 [Thermotogaceae bacterium]|nr:hypothetical protein [Thermotogaceae bacterium]